MTLLVIPPDVEDAEDAHEMIRFWVKDGESHLSLNIGLFEPNGEAELWGSMIADIAIHAARGMAHDRPDTNIATNLLAQIEIGFVKRLKSAPESTGQLKGNIH